METLKQFVFPEAGVLKLVDKLDLGSSAVRCMGSTPFARTKIEAISFEVASILL